MDKGILKLAGFGEGETEVYLSLLKLGPSTATKLAQHTGRHRTHVYDTLEKLMVKALVSAVKSGKTKLFSAADPEKIAAYIEENNRIIRGIIPELKQMQKAGEETVKVEVLKGKNGLVSLERDIARNSKEICCFGVEDKKFFEAIPIEFQQFLKQVKQKKIKERLIVSEEEEFFMEKELSRYRTIPKRFFSPIATNVYGKKVSIVLWQPLIVISIESSELAENYRKQFNLVWKIAKPVRKSRKARELV